MEATVRERGEQLARNGVYAGGALALLAVVVGVWHTPAPFCWHPILMTLGFAVLMTHGVLIGVQARQCPAGDIRVALLKRHMLVQIAANLAVIGGLAAIYRNKELHGKTHFHTTHAQLGILTMGAAFASPLLGVLGFRTLGVGRFLSEPVITTIKVVHRTLGRAAYLLGIVTSAYGAYVFLQGASFFFAEVGFVACFASQVLSLLIARKGPSKMLP